MAVPQHYAVLTTLILSVCIGQISAQNYTCDPITCKLPACFCPGQASPLPLDQTPQFILFTHDDTTGPISVPLMLKATEGLTNPNNCSIPATYFTMQANTQCDWVKAAYDSGSEIATHTVSHMTMPVGFAAGVGSITKEIVGVRDFLVNNCSIPVEDIVGFRSPYLYHHSEYRAALFKNGFMYDSTINEHWPMPTSPTGEQRLWPYTMDKGIPQDCAWTSNVCTANETYPGVWEVPVWVLQTETYPDPAYTMDPCDGTAGECETFELLQNNFNRTYNSNRAPLPVFVHSPWLQDQKQMTATQNFFKWVTTNYPDVYFVTMHQLVEWLKNPVPKTEMNAWLGCAAGGRAAGAPAAVNRTTMPAVNPPVLPAIPVADPTDPATATIVDPLKATTGINITMILTGRNQVAFVTDLKYPFEAAVARAIGVDGKAVRITGATAILPPSAATGSAARRLAQMTSQAAVPTPVPALAVADPPKPQVEVRMRVSSNDPVGVYNNATVGLAPGSEFDTEVLPPYQLEIAAPPIIVAFKDDQVLSMDIDGKPVDESSPSSGNPSASPSTTSSATAAFLQTSRTATAAAVVVIAATLFGL